MLDRRFESALRGWEGDLRASLNIQSLVQFPSFIFVPMPAARIDTLLSAIPQSKTSHPLEEDYGDESRTNDNDQEIKQRLEAERSRLRKIAGLDQPLTSSPGRTCVHRRGT